MRNAATSQRCIWIDARLSQCISTDCFSGQNVSHWSLVFTSAGTRLVNNVLFIKCRCSKGDNKEKKLPVVSSISAQTYLWTRKNELKNVKVWGFWCIIASHDFPASFSPCKTSTSSKGNDGVNSTLAPISFHPPSITMPTFPYQPPPTYKKKGHPLL